LASPGKSAAVLVLVLALGVLVPWMLRTEEVWLPEVLETPTELGPVTLRPVAPGSVPPP
jgi:hypothetical protein